MTVDKCSLARLEDSLFHNAYVFADFYDPVSGDVFKALRGPARPANLDGIGLGGLAQPEMQAEVALRDVATAAAHLLRLLVIPHAHGDSCTDGIAVGLRSF